MFQEYAYIFEEPVFYSGEEVVGKQPPDDLYMTVPEFIFIPVALHILRVVSNKCQSLRIAAETAPLGGEHKQEIEVFSKR